MYSMYNVNIEAHSCNHFCSGKAVCQRVFVALGIQHATRMRHIVNSGRSGSNKFSPHYQKNGTIFGGGGVTEYKMYVLIIIVITTFLHGLGRLTCSGIDALPSFPGSSTVSSSQRFVVEGVFRESGVVHSFKVIDPVLFVFESHVLYSRDFQFFTCDFASYFIQSCESRNTSQKSHLCSFQMSHVSLRGSWCVSIFSKNASETFLILIRNEPDMIKNVKREERKPTRCNNIDGLLSIMDVGY